MWFKNLIAYRLTQDFSHSGEALENALLESAFTPCGTQDLSRFGWVSPAGDMADQLAYELGGFILLCAQKEEKILPAGVIKRQLDEQTRQIEDEQHRKVYRKERDQLKDEIIQTLLPRAFSRFQRTYALIAPQHGLIFVDAASHKRAEDLLSHLRNTLGSLPLALPEVKQSPAAVMSHWLEQQATPSPFSLLDECEMRDTMAENGVIRIKGHELESDEIIAHLENGKRVTRLALEWDETLRLMLHEDLSIHRIKLSDQFAEQLDQDKPEEALACFDADLVQMGQTFVRLIPQVFEVLGGEQQR